MTPDPRRTSATPGLAGAGRPRGIGSPPLPFTGRGPGGRARADGDAGTATDDAVGKAFAFVLRSTANRPQSEAELATKLRGREFDEEVVDATLARARAVGAVDDAAFARAWVEDRGHRRGYGLRRLRQELARRGVPDDVAESALAGLEARDELAVATDLARRRAQQLPASLQPEAVARRLVGFLARRGYPEGLARRAALTASGLDRDGD